MSSKNKNIVLSEVGLLAAQSRQQVEFFEKGF